MLERRQKKDFEMEKVNECEEWKRIMGRSVKCKPDNETMDIIVV